MKKIMVLGASGQLGHRLFLDLREDFQVVGVVRTYPKEFAEFGVKENDLVTGFDVNDFSGLEKIISQHKPDVVINCIGFVKQRTPQSDDEMIEINSRFPQKLAEHCQKNKIYLVHFSTDCVFTGHKGNYSESEMPDATDLYGASKRDGEISDNSSALTLRTSIIGRELRNNTGLVEWFLSQAKGTTIKGFRQAIWSGLPTHTISSVVRMLLQLEKPITGLYHLAVHPINKFDLLSLLNQRLQRKMIIEPVDEPRIERSLSGERLRAELQSRGVESPPLGSGAPQWPQLVDDVLIDFDKYEKFKGKL